MDGLAHHRKAEELAAKAEECLGQGDGQETAAVWAAVAQVHATLALAAATGKAGPRPTLPRPGKASPAPPAEQLIKPPPPRPGNRLHWP
jgi:hypothetical protein